MKQDKPMAGEQDKPMAGEFEPWTANSLLSAIQANGPDIIAFESLNGMRPYELFGMWQQAEDAAQQLKVLAEELNIARAVLPVGRKS